MLFYKLPDYTTMKVFGCSCYPYLRPYNHHKLAYRSERCIFLGYSSLHKGYLCLHSSGRIYISNHVIINENTFSFESGVDFSSSSNSCSFSLSPSVISSFTLPLRQLADQLDNSQPQSSAAFDSLLLTIEPHTPNLTPVTISSIHYLSPLTLYVTGHFMLTRSKAGIFKPKRAYLATCLSKSS